MLHNQLQKEKHSGEIKNIFKVNNNGTLASSTDVGLVSIVKSKQIQQII